MSLSSGEYSLSDIAAVTNGNNRNNDGMWGQDGWWIILLFLFAFGGGWGGFGNRGGYGAATGGGAVDGYILSSDFANIERKLDGVNNGLCTGFFDVAQQFGGVNMNIANGFSRLDTSLCQLGNNVAQQINGVQSQLASCCCETQREIERGFSQTNYNIATQACDTRNLIQTATRDIIENQNCGTRAIIDLVTSNKIDMLEAKIGALQCENQGLKDAASREMQNTYLVSQMERLNPNRCPNPAYIVPNPNCCYNYSVQQQGVCGCGGNF